MELPLPAPDDPRDADFQIGHKSLGAVIDQGIQDLSGGLRRDVQPRRHERLSFLLMGHTLQEMANAFHALDPRERTLTYGTMASDALRTLCDMFGRQLAVWGAESPENVLAGDVAEGLRQEALALDAAAAAGIDVSGERARLESVRAKIGVDPKAIRVANELERAKEHEVLCIFRWESSHVHMGHAAVAASGRTLRKEGGGQADVVMYPMSLWRAGQIMWAVYGVGLRLLTFLGHKLSIDLAGVRRLDESLRPVVRKAAIRDKRADEPAGPPYGLFTLPLWIE